MEERQEILREKKKAFWTEVKLPWGVSDGPGLQVCVSEHKKGAGKAGQRSDVPPVFRRFAGGIC